MTWDTWKVCEGEKSLLCSLPKCNSTNRPNGCNFWTHHEILISFQIKNIFCDSCESEYYVQKYWTFRKTWELQNAALWEHLIGCQGGKLFLLKYVTITTVTTATVTTVTSTTVTTVIITTVNTVTITNVTIVTITEYCWWKKVLWQNFFVKKMSFGEKSYKKIGLKNVLMKKVVCWKKFIGHKRLWSNKI